MTRSLVRSRSWPALALAAMVMVAAACGGSPPGGGGSNVVATTEPECRGTGVQSVRSTSHKVRAASSTRPIAMSWSTAPGATGYSFEFTKQRDTNPDAKSDLEATEVKTSSLDLPDGEWYFHLLPLGVGGAPEAVHCGPYVIATNLAQGTQAAKGTTRRVRLTVRVEGGSSVEFHNFNRDKYYCGDPVPSGLTRTCELDVPEGSEVAIQRTLKRSLRPSTATPPTVETPTVDAPGLTNAEEARWRIASWGQACATTNANTEPRGGQCKLLMDGDKVVTVTFERRAQLRVTHQLAGAIPLGFAWSLGATDQKSGGNPLAFRPAQQNCQLPHVPRQFAGPAADFREADPCDIWAMYDVGSTVTMTIGSGIGDVTTFQGWGGACAGSGRSATCTLTLTEDAAVTTTFAQR